MLVSLAALCASAMLSCGNINTTADPDHPYAMELSATHGAVYVSDHETSGCGEVFAVDGEGQGWYGKSCDRPLRVSRANRLAPADVTQLDAGFAALPQESKCTRETSQIDGRTSIGLTRRRLSGAFGDERSWVACTDGSRAASPYQEADALIVRLVGVAK